MSRQQSGLQGILGQWVLHPACLFALLSLGFGFLTMGIVAPLRGHDEPAHFLRAYAFARGEILLSTKDAHGRSGTYLPARLYDDFTFFEQLLHRSRATRFDYRTAMAEHGRWRANLPVVTAEDPPVFVLYAGSEAYTPIGYIPFIVGAAAARLLGLDFIGTLNTMRTAGLLSLTAVIAWAIAWAPRFGWTLLLIAMLPSALYARAIVGVDGSALAFTLMAIAVCLRTLRFDAVSAPVQRALWVILSMLTKPPHIVFVLLEAVTGSFRELRSRWRTTLLVVLPGLLLAPVWLLAVSSDVATWRLTFGSDRSPELYDPVRKLAFMLANPWHFPYAVLNSMDYGPEILRQIIGVLGWLDTYLRAWVYPMLALLLLLVSAGGWDYAPEHRRRVALVAATIAIAYVVAVYLIFYLGWSPLNYDRVDGVQGRYFTVALAPLCLMISALVRVGPNDGVRAAMALVGALIAGIATFEAVLRTDWP